MITFFFLLLLNLIKRPSLISKSRAETVSDSLVVAETTSAGLLSTSETAFDSCLITFSLFFCFSFASFCFSSSSFFFSSSRLFSRASCCFLLSSSCFLISSSCFWFSSCCFWVASLASSWRRSSSAFLRISSSFESTFFSSLKTSLIALSISW